MCQADPEVRRQRRFVAFSRRINFSIAVVISNEISLRPQDSRERKMTDAESYKGRQPNGQRDDQLHRDVFLAISGIGDVVAFAFIDYPQDIHTD